MLHRPSPTQTAPRRPVHVVHTRDSATDPIQLVRRSPIRQTARWRGFAHQRSRLAESQRAQSIERLFAVMGPSPATMSAASNPVRGTRELGRSSIAGHAGRSCGPDADSAAHASKGSIERFFLEDTTGASRSLGRTRVVSRRALETDLRAAYGGRTPRRASLFFSRPSCGGACKRLNLFLRWMVRRDAVDFGIWTDVSPAKLIIPLDTHVIRVGRCLGLTRYASPGWKMAADITASLRALDPDDPVKYDFSLCHLGMADMCGFNRAKRDSQCPLRGQCRPTRRGARHAAGRPRASARPSDRR